PRRAGSPPPTATAAPGATPSAPTSAVVREALAAEGALGVVRRLALGAAGRPGHDLEAAERDLLAAVLAAPEVLGRRLEPTQGPIDGADGLGRLAVPRRGQG